VWGTVTNALPELEYRDVKKVRLSFDGPSVRPPEVPPDLLPPLKKLVKAGYQVEIEQWTDTLPLYEKAEIERMVKRNPKINRARLEQETRHFHGIDEALATGGQPQIVPWEAISGALEATAQAQKAKRRRARRPS
jgi:hypothetical protein